MIVYIVYGNLNRWWDCDYKICGVFHSRKSAEDYMIKLARTAFDEDEVPAEVRECTYEQGLLSAIMDNDNYQVELFLKEVEVQE